MKITPKHYAESFVALASEKNEAEIDSLAREFVRYFAKRGKAKLLRVIIREISALLSRKDARRTVAVTVAREQKNLSSLVKKSLSYLGTMDLAVTVDPSLIGGMILQIDDIRVDASLSNQLRRLRAHIKA